MYWRLDFKMGSNLEKKERRGEQAITLLTLIKYHGLHHALFYLSHSACFIIFHFSGISLYSFPCFIILKQFYKCFDGIRYGLNSVPTQFICLSPNPSDLRL